MAKGDAHALKKHLIKAYGGFADKRFTRIESGSTFIVDDRKPGDHGSNGQLFGSFTPMYLTVVSADLVSLRMTNVPDSAGVRDWFEAHGTRMGYSGWEVAIERGAEADLSDLAEALRAITAPGQRYAVAYYKYAVPRTASSLRRLQKVLKQAWS